jgi:hypothetical protein
MNTFFFYLNTIALSIGVALILALRKQYIHWAIFIVVCYFIFCFIAVGYTFDRIFNRLIKKYEPSVIDTIVYDIIPVCITAVPYIIVLVTKSNTYTGNNGKNSFFRKPFNRNRNVMEPKPV